MSDNMKNILPYARFVDLSDDSSMIRDNNLHITDAAAYTHGSMFIRVHVNWNDANCRAKYGVHDSMMFSTDSVHLTIKFPDLPYIWTDIEGGKHDSVIGIEVGLKKSNGGNIGYRPLYFDNLKYGVDVYFANRKFDYLKQKLIARYDATTGVFA